MRGPRHSVGMHRGSTDDQEERGVENPPHCAGCSSPGDKVLEG